MIFGNMSTNIYFLIFISCNVVITPTYSLRLPSHIDNVSAGKWRSLNSQISQSNYSYTTKYIDVKVDHFSYTTDATFKMRYLINTDYWTSNGPIFFYTGNEGQIDVFCNNTGFMWDLGPKFGAMLVFAEHRYYGQSLPFPECCTSSQLAYLTSEQALADYAELIHHIKLHTTGAALSPVIVFGGSYGGMLSAWFRIKYPHLVQGAIAASAPVIQFLDLTPCDRFNQVVTRTFSTPGPGGGSKICRDNIRRSWDVLNKLAKTEKGRADIKESMNLCNPLTIEEGVVTLKNVLSDVWVTLSMSDYPYPTNFLTSLPAWPVTVSCSHINNTFTDDLTLLGGITRAAGVFLNYTGHAGPCLNISTNAYSGLDASYWPYQTCTEMVMPMCTDGVSDMFEPNPWNLTQYKETCFKSYQTKPQPYWIPLQYGGYTLQAASNIIFSNGHLDPWSSGGIRQSINPSVIALDIALGAHHLDLRAAHPLDPPDVRKVRQVEETNIRMWIKQYHQAN